jgi:hypothetical protein
MTLRELASPRFYAWLIADIDLGRSDVADPAPALAPPRRVPLEIDDDFEETRPCPWYVTATDDPPSAHP